MPRRWPLARTVAVTLVVASAPFLFTAGTWMRWRPLDSPRGAMLAIGLLWTAVMGLVIGAIDARRALHARLPFVHAGEWWSVAADVTAVVAAVVTLQFVLTATFAALLVTRGHDRFIEVRSPTGGRIARVVGSCFVFSCQVDVSLYGPTGWRQGERDRVGLGDIEHDAVAFAPHSVGWVWANDGQGFAVCGHASDGNNHFIAAYDTASNTALRHLIGAGDALADGTSHKAANIEAVDRTVLERLGLAPDSCAVPDEPRR